MTSKDVASYEDKKEDIVVKDFGGVNLSAHRTGIGKDEFAWLENLIPIGHANMPVIPWSGASFAVPNAKFMAYANIGGTDFMFVVKTDGSLSAVNLNTLAVTNNIFPAASLNTATVAMAQWKNERIIIVDNTNYRSWDGTLTFANGSVVQLTVTVAGGGYTAIPVITFTGGSGLGAAATAAMQLNGTQAIVGAGTGYVVGDILTLDPAFGGNGGVATVKSQLRVDTIGGGGTITALSIYRAGLFTSLPTLAPAALSGGSGTGGTFTPLWNVASLTITNGGTTAYIAAPTVVFTGGGFSSTAVATSLILAGPTASTLMGTAASSVATAFGRVWVGNGRLISYTAPDSWFDFTAANAGGSFLVSDETLEKNVNQLVSANNFLHIVGDTSIDTVSDVRVGTGPVTLFSKVNISAQIGSTSGPGNPLIPFGKMLLFSAPYGIYSVAGATPRKVSDKLDILFKTVTQSGTFAGAGVCKLYGNLCPVFLVTYPDPVPGTTRRLLVLLYQGRWFFATQGAPALIAEATVSGVQKTYASDGTTIYELFGETTNATAITWKAVTALWPAKTPVSDKQVFKCGVEVSPVDNPLVVIPGATTDVPITISVDLDNERGSQVGAVVLNNFGQWINAAGVVGSWVNAAGAVGDWLEPGFNILQQDAQTKGRYVGYTLNGSTRGFTINGILGQIEERAKWNASGVS